MKKTLKRIKSLPTLMKISLIVLLLIIIIFYPYLSGNRSFLFNADQQLQYNYFYNEWNRLLDLFFDKGVWPFYSFNTFLGSNFFASKAYYVTGDIFMPFLRQFENIEVGLMFETLLLIWFSSMGCGLFLKKFGIKKEKIIIFISILYAFSGIAEIYIGQYMFHRFYAFFPFLLYGVEIYRKDRKLSIFVLSTLILFLSSYYFMFPTSLFLVFYFIFTNAYHNNKFDFIKILQNSIPLICAYLVGFLLSAILIVPAFYELLGNQRIGNSENIGILFDFKVYIGYIFNYITAPFNLYTEIPYMFFSGFNGHLTWYSIYTSIVVTPLLFSIFFRNKELKNKLLRYLVVILIIFTLVPALNSVFHGFSEPSFRWMFIVVLVNLLIVAIVLDDTIIDTKLIIRGGILYSSLFLLMFTGGVIFGALDLFEFRIHIFVSFFCFLLLWGYMLLIYRKMFLTILVFSIIECTSFYAISLTILNKNYYFSKPTINADYIHYNESQDEDKFFRMAIDNTMLSPFSDLNLNQSIILDYKGVSTYDSMLESNLSEFLDLNGINWHIVNLDNADVLRMLGVKYVYEIDIANLPTDAEFEYETNVNHFEVYQLKNYRPIGFTYNNFINQVNVERNSSNEVIEADIDWNNELLVQENLFSKVKDIPADSESIDFELIEYYTDNSLYGFIENEEPTVLFFSIPYNEGWTILDNNKMIEKYSVQGGFIGVYLEPGEHYLNITFKPKGLKIGLLMSCIGAVLFIGIVCIDFKKRKKSSGGLYDKED